MSEMQLRQPGFTYSACGLFMKNKERMQEFKETWDSRYIYQIKLDKTFFNMIWLMEILHIYLEEQLLMTYHVIKHLKGYTPNCSGELFEIRKVKILCHWHT